MGAKQSTSVKQSATILSLDPKQEKFIAIMDNMLSQLVKATNPINFEKALTAARGGTCGGMLVLIQPLIQSQFQTFLIENPQTRQGVYTYFKSYGSTIEEIDALMSDEVTRTICREITKFFLRFILTIVSLVLSVRTNRQTLALLGTLTSTLPTSTDIVDSSKGYSELFYGTGFAAGTSHMQSLQKGDRPQEEEKLSTYINKLFKENTKDSSNKEFIEQRSDRHYLIKYRGVEYMFDIRNKQFYQFFTENEKRVGVLELTASNRDDRASVEIPKEKIWEKPEQKPVYRPPQGPQQGGKTRSNKKVNERKTRKNRKESQFGGDGEEVGIVQANRLTYYIYNRGQIECQNVGARTVRERCVDKTQRVIEDTNKKEYDNLKKFIEEIVSYYTSIYDNPENPTRKNLDNKDVKWKIVSKYVGKPADTKVSSSSLTITNNNTYTELVKLLSDSPAMVNTKEGTSFAFYRAYLIASGLIPSGDKVKLQTYYCNDLWKNKKLDEIPAFALLQNLFNDKLEAISEKTEESKAEFDNFVTRFSNIGTTKKDGDGKSFNSYKFLEVNSEKCRSNKGSQSLIYIDEESKIEEARDAFGQIGAELINHINNIQKIIGEMIDVNAFLAPEPKLKIQPVFFMDKEGASKALEKIIKKARVALEEHYINVETQYKRGVLAIEPTATFGSYQQDTSQPAQQGQPVQAQLTETLL
jgi:hypothetical protein